MNDKVWTIKEILSWTTQYFSDKSIDSPRLTAELLLSNVLNKDRIHLYINFFQPLNREELKQFKELIKRRINGEPVAYIIGEKEFWSLNFKVDKNVLIPRPETEVLIENISEFISKDENIKILEIGTGSGNIATALAHEHKNIEVFAVDISFDALNIAKKNISLNNVTSNVYLINGDIFQGIRKYPNFDFIISNPPYIKEKDIETLQKEIKDYEPLSALNGGKDGLFFYGKILSKAKDFLKDSGMVFFEFGEENQGEEIKKIMLDFNYKHIVIKNDYSNTPRVIYCSK